MPRSSFRPLRLPLLAAALAGTLAATARADLTNSFSSNPLTDGSAQIQGPGAPGANTRFTYNADGTLTAHYDTTLPTIKLVFPIGRHFTQASSFTMTTTFKVLSAGLVSPPDFGASAPAFGMLNTVTTGSTRNSTGYFDSSFNFVEVTPGDTYDLLSLDYFPTQDNTFGGNSIDLTAIHSAQPATSFNGSFSFGYANVSLPLDQFLTATLAYSAATHMATLNLGSGPIAADLTGAAFDVDSFAITLWQDTNLNPAAPAVPSGSPVAADVVFDAFSVVATPEPSSLLLMLGSVLLIGRRNRR